MSETNLTLRELFSVSGEELVSAPPLGFRLETDTTVMKEELQKLAKRVPWPAVKESLAQKTEGLLDVPLLDVVMGGWKKLAEVMEYADTHKYPLGTTNLVALAEHKVKSEHHPYIEVLVKGRPVAKIVFDIEVVLTVEGLVLKIENAMVKSVQSGTLRGNGSVSLKGTTLLKKTFPTVPLPGTLYLGTGVPLAA
jgi:hypothetical protein